MHSILGANGIIGEELAKVLQADYGKAIRLVGRHPLKVNPDDELMVADLLVKDDVIKALKHTDIAFLTVGLPFRSDIWLRDWVRIMENVIEGCKKHSCKLVYFDNTYIFAQHRTVQNEQSPVMPSGKKGEGKLRALKLLLNAIDQGQIEAIICRAPEFYGPGKTKSITNAMIFDAIRKEKKVRVFLRDDVKRTLIYTPDASRATALLAHTPDAYGQTWHLPCDDQRMTYKEFIAEIGHQLGRKIDYQVLGMAAIKGLALVSNNMKETMELMPRYGVDNLFESNKFKKRFPEFEVTEYAKGIEQIIRDFGLS